jgi:hypothetical protein
MRSVAVISDMILTRSENVILEISSYCRCLSEKGDLNLSLMGKRQDVISYSFLILIAMLSFLALWKPQWFAIDDASELSNASVGEVINEVGNVRHKSSGSIVWHDLTNHKAPVAFGDAIFTGPDAKAKILFFAGVEIELSPNSMIILQRKSIEQSSSLWSANKKTPVLQVLSGGVQIRSSQNEQPIVVQAQGKTYQLDLKKETSDVTVNLADNALKISTTSTAPLEVEKVDEPKSAPLKIVSDQPSVLELPPAPAAEVATVAAVTQATPSPVSAKGATEASEKNTKSDWKLPGLTVLPLHASTRVLDKRQLYSIPIQIKWIPFPKDQLSASEPYAVEIFHGNEKIIDQPSLTEPHFEFELKTLDKNPYTYRVTANLVSGTKFKSDSLPIELHYFAPKVTIASELVNEDSKVLITWNRLALVSEYRVQIATDEKFENTVYRHEQKENLILYPVKNKGALFVRVQALLPEKPSDWSKVREIHIQ